MNPHRHGAVNQQETLDRLETRPAMAWLFPVIGTWNGFFRAEVTRMINRARWRLPIQALVHGLGCWIAYGYLVTASAAERITVEAIPARPFGIAQVTIQPTPGSPLALPDSSQFYLAEATGRVLYPVFTTGPLRRAVGGILGPNASRSVTVRFLFTGAGPLDITLHIPSPKLITIRPQPQPPRVYQRTIKRWWREYHAAVRNQEATGDYPPIVQTYLTSMLSRRLGMLPPLLSRPRKPSTDPVKNSLELLLGLEGLRLTTLRSTSLGGQPPRGPADRPLPPPLQHRLQLPAISTDQVTIEEIAHHVPRDCFYVRFGSFTNYLWLDQLVNEYGGDINRMVTLRGLSSDASNRLQQQLALKKSALANILGSQVIRDIAIIGRDAFVQQGAAVGVLFQARNQLLEVDLRKQRAAAAEREKVNHATLRTIQLAGQDVSFLSTPDNRLRSYYAVDGAFHLVTTSRAIAEQFLLLRKNKQALGNTPEFKQTRQSWPETREDTVFIYFSSYFQNGLLSPRYQVELPRRLRAATDLELIQLAKLAAVAEHAPGQTVDELIQAGLLPPRFRERVDGSQPITQNGKPADSLRGSPGNFLPIPDVPITGITAEEERVCQQTLLAYLAQWKQMDPVMIQMKRYALEKGGHERLVINARIAPLDENKYGRLASMLGPPTKFRISEPTGNAISVQASLRGGLVFPDVPPHTMFLGIRDSVPPTDLKLDGLFKTWSVLKTTPGYLGAWPQNGLLDRLPLGLAGQPDIHGFSQFPLGIWRKQTVDGFSIIGFNPQLLAEVAPQLKVEPTESAAQVRVRISDLSQAKFAHWINALNYQRARQTSAGNVRLLHLLTQQFGIPRQQAKTTAERLLQARLVCSLGGEYQVVTGPDGSTRWESSNGPVHSSQPVPANYQAPLLAWFRGLESSLTRQNNQLQLQAHLDLQRQAGSVPSILPSFFRSKERSTEPSSR